ncbi:hypothetical protein ACXHQ9_12200, partial [Vibrio cincinnatiensis]
HHKKITQVECGIKLTQSHKFAVNSSLVNSYEPTMPNEIEELKSILDKFAISYAFSDGSGFMTLNNFRFNGNGVSIYPDMLSS